MRDVSFTDEFSELSSAMRAGYSVIILLGSWLIAGCAALASAATSSTAGVPSYSSHGCAELLRLCFPLGKASLTSLDWHVLLALGLCSGRWTFLRVFALSHEYLFVLI